MLLIILPRPFAVKPSRLQNKLKGGNTHGIMSVNGKVKYPKKHLPCLHEQMLL